MQKHTCNPLNYKFCNYLLWLKHQPSSNVILCLSIQEIFSSDKTDHFQRIRSRTGVPFNSMLFFDDENRNIQAVKLKYIIFLIIIIGGGGVEILFSCLLE